ncbi:MAG TPA: hydroxyethylthiazole kinase [Methanocorpusculum sp.]|nr:hydroxyethylthiazole kinase [Methanocorpusculum sp.]
MKDYSRLLLESCQKSITENDYANMTVCVGALTNSQVEIMRFFASISQNNSAPVILDFVGAEASVKRIQTAYEFINNHVVSIVKGNVGQILALIRNHGKVYDINSLFPNATESAVKFAKNIIPKKTLQPRLQSRFQ